jgi:hypothetical protein
MDNTNDREKWIEKSREDFLKLAKEYQDDIVKMIRAKYLPLLDQKDGNIVFSAKNMSTIARLDTELKKISNLKGDKLLEWFVEQIEYNAKLNKNYFEEMVGEKGVSKAIEKATKTLSISLGIADQNGLLYDLSRISDPIRQIKAKAIKAISSGLSWGSFSNDITNFVGKGLVEGHMLTNAYDTFQQIDRSINYDVALDLGLNYAMYSPGVMKTSRQFCKDRVRKVFTRAEIEGWKKLEWQGKNDNYDPFIDVGGYNCTHTLSWITETIAFQRRPELRK